MRKNFENKLIFPFLKVTESHGMLQSMDSLDDEMLNLHVWLDNLRALLKDNINDDVISFVSKAMERVINRKM